jgi:hypothetical protein
MSLVGTASETVGFCLRVRSRHWCGELERAGSVVGRACGCGGEGGKDVRWEARIADGCITRAKADSITHSTVEFALCCNDDDSQQLLGFLVQEALTC